MGNFAQFMKENKVPKKNAFYAATKSLLDEKGQPLLWELQPISSQRNAVSCVVPDLYDTELQNSYGVRNPEDLAYAMVDDPGEYDDFVTFVQKFNGFTKSFEEKVDEAKNS